MKMEIKTRMEIEHEIATHADGIGIGFDVLVF
jgi:hypothetical protein